MKYPYLKTKFKSTVPPGPGQTCMIGLIAIAPAAAAPRRRRARAPVAAWTRSLILILKNSH
eukprot:SAG31_NODE_62_length_28678_cov_21.548270_20_plen_61_part_00